MKPCLETIGQLSELLPDEVFTKCVSESWGFCDKTYFYTVQKDTMQNAGIFSFKSQKNVIVLM